MWSGAYGFGLTVKAALVARATDRQCSSISSSKTSLVSSMPRATMAKLSPTRIMSMPAASATWALGKSCAVNMAIGSPFLCSVRKVPRVTFFLGLADGVPIGEWELYRAWRVDSSGLAARRDGRVPRAKVAHDRMEDDRYIGTCRTTLFRAK